MLIETIEAETRPMLYVTRSASMNPQDIAAIMADAFGAMGSFLGRSGVTPAGPPLAVYHDWDEAAGTMKIDVGFAVAPCDTTKATGDVHAGQTPSGKALKAVHHGPYPKLRDTYGALEAHMKTAGIAMPAFAWEVYLSDPDTTPAEDLLTEIYMPLA
jgi:effector-binding domain-containing protein